jgi:hypothetical protein
MGMCALYEGCALPAPDAEPGGLQPANSPMAAIRRNRIGLAVPSIAHAIISLCCMAEWQG